MRYRHIIILAVATLALGCSSSGNGRPGSKVLGKLTQGGNPVAGAKIIFIEGNQTGAVANGPTAVTDEAGEFVMVGVPPGTYKVVVYKLVPSKAGAKLPEEGEGMDMEQIEASGIGKHVLPAKFAKPATTTLTAVVESGESKVTLAIP